MKNLANALARLHRDDRGAEGLEKILIIAAIVLPLLAVLLIFRRSISDWVGSAWDSMLGESNNQQKPNPGQPSNP